MRKRAKYIRLLCVLICLAALCASLAVFAADTLPAYRDTLLKAGFPDSFVPMLCALHEKHPNWVFKPYRITSLRASFTWEYVIGQMMSDPARNLVVKSGWAPSPFSSLGDENYAPYRVNNGVTYDSGSWYAATEETVRYFMDARNFLNDTDCFMFLDFAYDGTPVITDGQVEAVLGTSVFAHTVIPDYDGKTTYASYINEVGTVMNVNPLFLAARLVQENGTGTSPMVNGTAGDYLGRPELNGLYNFYNISAGGTGYDQIYTNGMNEALTGTPSMADAWGGSGAWDTRWKAVYGGIYTIKTKYVDVFRNTLYLQKFNTDPRSKNVFCGYMQNIAAPLMEGRNFRKGIADDSIEAAYVFLIPVYDGMPRLPSSDPGKGRLLYSYSNPPVTDFADLQVGVTGGSTVSVNARTIKNAALFVVSYDAEGRMIHTESDTLSGEFSKTFDVPGADSVRVMVTDDAMRPLCAAGEVVL